MLRWYRRNLKPLGRGLLALMSVLWLTAAAAPCLMAQTRHMDQLSSHCPLHKDAVHADMNDCDPVTAINCQLPDINSPVATALDHLAVTPALLAILPASLVLSPVGHVPRREWRTPDIPAPPIHIQHLTLIL